MKEWGKCLHFFHTEITHLLSMPGLRQLPTLPNGSSATGHFPLVQESERCINSKDNTRNSSSTKSHTASLIYNVFNKTLLETEQQMEKKIIQKIEKNIHKKRFTSMPQNVIAELTSFRHI